MQAGAESGSWRRAQEHVTSNDTLELPPRRRHLFTLADIAETLTPFPRSSLLSGSKLLAAGLLLCQWAAAAPPSWTFADATLQISQKGGEAAPKQSFTPKSPIAGVQTLKPSDSLKILLTAKEGNKPMRPHQLFLLLKDPETGLESFFAFDAKESGKARLDITQKDIPTALLTAPSLTMTIAIASFGKSSPLSAEIATISPVLDQTAKKALPEPPLKYGKRPEIHHIFRGEPRSPPKIISIVFLGGVVACLPALFIAWFTLSANVSHLPKSLAASPIAHPLFFASLIALEGVFFAYYTSINIFQALAAAAIISPVALISGSRALREVRARRLNGER
ncbi:hypothetical protein Dda_8705 [Drechslerella dactyloides]|uniref:Ribophorin II C-terminal domain-containing protein n=1 Tax=Drechslerella dactyloides TaxID=74499 RepID=A0AAD6IR28_DREDA|nr:hypothetical protein Dda_8705 [Drechslerella dactyloides]